MFESLNKELVHSISWFLITLLAVMSLFFLAATLGILLTKRGKNWWKLNQAVLFTRTARWWWVLFVSLICFQLIQVRIVVLITYAQSQLFTGLQRFNQPMFWHGMYSSIILGSMAVALGITEFYVKELCTLLWQRHLTKYVLSLWLEHDHYYFLRFSPKTIDNPDQRIESDSHDFAQDSIHLMLGVIFSLISAEEAIRILWKLSSPLTIWSITIPKALLTLTVIFVLFNTLCAYFISHPLIRLHFMQQGLIANFRFSLSRLRLHATQVALLKGNTAEEIIINHKFSAVVHGAMRIIVTRTILNGFNSSTEQISGFFGYLIQAPLFFAHKLSLGSMVQGQNMIGSLSSSLSFFQNSFEKITSYFATIDRLWELEDEINQIESRHLPQPILQGRNVECHKVNIFNPTGKILIKSLNLELTPGKSLLISGPSGIGKSTLFLALAGLWPYMEGTCNLPAEKNIAFVPQKTYIPTDTFAATLRYPETDSPQSLNIEYIREVLTAVGFEQEIDFEDTHEWEQEFSPGQLQKIAFARLIIHQSTVIFLDESTASLDEINEKALYHAIRSALPESIIISIGHRDTLRDMHDQELIIADDGKWELISFNHDHAA